MKDKTLVKFIGCGELNNDYLVDLIADNQRYLGIESKRDDKVLDAMRKVDREKFLPPGIVSYLAQTYIPFKSVKKEEVSTKDIKPGPPLLMVELRHLAYNDEMIPIGHYEDQVQTCSQPSMVAFMNDVLELGKGMKVLEIGTGCGYHAAVTSQMVGEEGKVFSVEIIKDLRVLAEANLRYVFGEEFEKRFYLFQGDGSIGLKEHAPFDRIYLTAGIKLASFKPSILGEQLNPNGGILLFPEERGSLIKQKYENGVSVEKMYNRVMFVPLLGENS